MQCSWPIRWLTKKRPSDWFRTCFSSIFRAGIHGYGFRFETQIVAFQRRSVSFLCSNNLFPGCFLQPDDSNGFHSCHLPELAFHIIDTVDSSLGLGFQNFVIIRMLSSCSGFRFNLITFVLIYTYQLNMAIKRSFLPKLPTRIAFSLRYYPQSLYNPNILLLSALIAELVTFNFFVLHRPKIFVAMAYTLLFLLMQPEMVSCNELPISFPLSDYPAFLSFGRQVAFFQTHHNYIVESDSMVSPLCQATVRLSVLLYISLPAFTDNSGDSVVVTVSASFVQISCLPPILSSEILLLTI